MENKETQISIELFEKNARIHNQKNLRRSILTMHKHAKEYVNIPGGLTNECVMEINVDKSALEDVMGLLKGKGYRIIGTENILPIEISLNSLLPIRDKDDNVKGLIAQGQNDLEIMTKRNKEYMIDENDDAKFLFSPKNDDVNNVIEFIQDVNAELRRIAEEKDVTILIYVTNVLKNLSGAIAYNFVDQDSEDNKVIDFQTSFILNVNMANAFSTYYAGYAASYLASDISDLDFLNLSIMATNLKYKE